MSRGQGPDSEGRNEVLFWFTQHCRERAADNQIIVGERAENLYGKSMKESKKTIWGFIDPGNESTEPLEMNPSFIEMPRGDMFIASLANILRHAYGFVETVETGKAVDADGNELPLYSYPAIEYLTQFDYSGKRVFEFGAGISTIFWMKRAKEVVSVENNQEWIAQLNPSLEENATLLAAEGNDFPLKIRETTGKFDVIVVDGAGYRYDSAVEAVDRLEKGGMIVLDNSDWHFNTAAYLKNAGLLQVDMTGFKPCYSHTSTTSIFFDREFNFPILADRQPVHGVGAKRLHSDEWDKPYSGGES